MDYRKVKGIVVDAGHGGDDPGASGNGIIENSNAKTEQLLKESLSWKSNANLQ